MMFFSQNVVDCGGLGLGLSEREKEGRESDTIRMLGIKRMYVTKQGSF